MIKEQTIPTVQESEIGNSSRFHQFVITGNNHFDSGDINLRFPELVDGGHPYSHVKIKMVNSPKAGLRHSSDFACVAVRTAGTQDNGYPLVVIDAVCIDGLHSPDFSGEGLPPDSQASKILIDAVNANSFREQIDALGDLDDFVNYNPSLQKPYFGKAKTFGLQKDWKITTIRGDEFDVKGYLRQKYMRWMIDPLQQGIPIKDNRPLHWYAGVYGIFHIVCDPHDKLIHYLFLGSGDVEAQLIRNRRPHELHEDSNWPADTMGEAIGISGADRYPGKVYKIYDVVGPTSRRNIGPFTASIGYERNGVDLLLRSDGYLAITGEDDATSISISVDI